LLFQHSNPTKNYLKKAFSTFMRILFTHSYFYRFDAKQWRAQQPYPPYGTLYAAAVMRECGAEVSLHDVALSHGPEELAPRLAREQPDYVVIYDDGFNYLTKMCLTRMREAAWQMAQMARAAGCKVVVCSSDSTDHWQEYLSNGVDVVVLGEGEITLRELLMTWDSNPQAPLELIQGIAFTNSDGIPAKNTARPVTTELDALPDPAWDLVDLGAYKSVWIRSHGYFSLNMATTRGCPYKCNWCAKPIYGNRYNVRSPQRVAAEMERLTRAWQVDHWWMSDDIFGLQPKWVQAFRNEVQARGLVLRYKIQSRADLLLKEDNIAALVESGLQQVWIGAESGSQKILDAMDKGITVEEIAIATRQLRQQGVEVCYFLQFGYLGENMTDIEMTLNMVETLLPHDIGVSVSYPLPGTKFYDKVKALLGQKQNWADSDDLAMMYPATFSPAFYRRLHRLVHKRFRLKQGIQAAQLLLSGQKANLRRAAMTLYYAPAAVIDRWRLARLQ
jgi:anaerobic magnesium-protoporphyrin IX monomethyl ester cyclase